MHTFGTALHWPLTTPHCCLSVHACSSTRHVVLHRTLAESLRQSTDRSMQHNACTTHGHMLLQCNQSTRWHIHTLRASASGPQGSLHSIEGIATLCQWRHRLCYCSGHAGSLWLQATDSERRSLTSSAVCCATTHACHYNVVRWKLMPN